MDIFRNKIILLFPVIILTIFVLYHSTKLFVSSVISVFPRQVIEQWSCLGGVSDNDLWEEQKKLLKIAIDLSHLDSELLVDMGRMHDLKALSSSVWKKTAKDNRETAIKYYRLAINRNPNWALPWINLAQSKILKNEIDNEAFRAIRKTLIFGRWQSDIQQKTMWLTIGIWNSIPNDIKQHTRNLVKENMRDERRSMATILTSFRFNWQSELKKLVANKKQLALIRKLEQDEHMLANMFANMNHLREC